MISELKKLVRFKTIAGNFKENDAALKWISSGIYGSQYDIREFKSKKYSSLIITAQKTTKPRIMLVGHMDVAKAGNDMFIPKIKNNRMYARGVYDMKFALACYLRLLSELEEDALKYDFGVMITTDEECGGENGVKYLLDRGYGCDVAVLPDGGENWQMEKAAKGVWSLVVKSYGKSAHPSMPWLGINAVEVLMDYLRKLQQKFKKEPCRDPLHVHSTMDINEFNTGHTGDNIPDYAEAMVDIFFTDEKECENIMKGENDLRKEYPEIKLSNILLRPSIKIDTNNRYANEFYRSARELYGIKKKTFFAHGTSDAHYFIERGIPVIETRPNGGGFHGDDEWIDLFDLERFYNVLKRFIEKDALI